MAADPEMWKSFLEWCERAATKLREELAPYEAGTQRVSRGAGGEWVDITASRIEQIKREIASLENTMARIRKDHG